MIARRSVEMCELRIALEVTCVSCQKLGKDDCEQVLAAFTAAGIDLDLAERLQDEGTKSFARAWNSLMAVIAAKREPWVEGGVAETNS